MSRPEPRATSLARGAADTFGGALGMVLGFARWFFVGRVDAPRLGEGGELPWLVPHVRARRSAYLWLVVRMAVLVAVVLATAWAVIHPIEAALGVAALLLPSFGYFVVRADARARLLREAAAPVVGGVAPRRSLPVARSHSGHVTLRALLPTASLDALRRAIAHLRGGELAEALADLDRVETGHLRADELRIADAVGAWAALLAGDRRAAAARAVGAVPTGLSGIDALLLPICIANALHDPVRLARLVDAWDGAHGRWEASTELDELRSVALLKLGRLQPEEVPVDRRAALVERCRGLGERALATALTDSIPLLPGAYR